MKKVIEAPFYGVLELIPGVKCDVYVLKDASAVMSERGLAKLLSMDQYALQALTNNWPPKYLKPFIDKGSRLESSVSKVSHKKSPHYGVKLKVYYARFIEILLRVFALAFEQDLLRVHQYHIGTRCTALLSSLINTGLEVAIREACGFSSDIQQIVMRFYKDTIFAQGCMFLYKALQEVYPNRDRERYGFLMATFFRYCYEDVLGKSLYKLLKSKKGAYPLHQYIMNNNLRETCIAYIEIFAFYMLETGCKMPEARNHTRKILNLQGV